MDLLALSVAKKFTMEKLPCYFGDPIDLNVEWDGVIGDRYYEDSTSGTSGGKYVRISDYVPTEEQLQTMTILQRKSDGTTVEYGWDMIKKRRKNEALAEGGTKITCYPYLMIVPKNYITTTIGTHGIYAYHLPEIYTERVHIPCIDYEVGKTIDPRFLPSGGGGGGLPVVEVKDLDLVLGGLRTEGADALKNAILNGTPFILKGTYKALNDTGESMSHDDLPDATSETVVSVYSIDGVKFCYLTALTANMMEWKYIAVVEDGEMFIEKFE